jgi:hypothetical protein
MLAGRFSGSSFAGVDSHDLYLEEAYDVLPDGNLGEPLGYALFVPAAEIKQVAFIPHA